MVETLSNFASTIAASAMTNVVTTVTLSDAARFPTTGNFRIRIDDELMLVATRSGNVLTGITRGIESTLATSHSAGAAVRQVLSVGGLTQFINERGLASGTLWDAKGDLAVGTAADTATRLAVGTDGDTLMADSAAATGVKWKSWPVIDVGEKYNIVTGVATAQQRLDNRTNLNLAFTENLDQGGRRLLLPPGLIEVSGGTVGFTVTTDTTADLEIFGHVHRGTTIYQRETSQGVMKFETTGGNLRGLHVHDFQLRGTPTTPGYDLELLKVGYSFFERLTFWTGGGLHCGTSCFQNVISDCWWLNVDSGSRAVLVDTSSEVTLTNPLIGEDGGSIKVNAGNLRIVGGQMRQWFDGVEPSGPDAMGSSHMIVTGDGTLVVDGAAMQLDQCANLLALNNGIATIKNCRISCGDETITARTLINQRTMTGPQYFKFQDNAVEMHDASVACTLQIYDQFGGTEPHDSIISGNTFLSGTNQNMTIEDTFLRPSNRNSWTDNSFLETTGVT